MVTHPSQSNCKRVDKGCRREDSLFTTTTRGIRQTGVARGRGYNSRLDTLRRITNSKNQKSL